MFGRHDVYVVNCSWTKRASIRIHLRRTIPLLTIRVHVLIFLAIRTTLPLPPPHRLRHQPHQAGPLKLRPAAPVPHAPRPAQRPPSRPLRPPPRRLRTVPDTRATRTTHGVRHGPGSVLTSASAAREAELLARDAHDGRRRRGGVVDNCPHLPSAHPLRSRDEERKRGGGGGGP